MNTGILIAAGGTGGHISPGVSLARTFIQHNFHVTFITLQKNITYPDVVSLAKESNVQILAYPAPSLPTGISQIFPFLKNLWICWKMLRHTIQGRRPVLIGMGGFPSFPALLYARLKKIPYYLCEQNAISGKITRLFSRKAEIVFHAFENAAKKSNHILTGNPLREMFLSHKKKRAAKIPPRKIFMIGGSLGAGALNELYKAMRQNPFFAKYTIHLVTGGKDIDKPLAKHDTVQKFVLTMSKALQESDIVISRAGSGLLYEILWSKRPAILLPYPFAADDHQKANAMELQEKGYAKVIDMRPFHANSAAEKVQEILSGKSLQEMVNRYKLPGIFPLDAHEKIFQYVYKKITEKGEK